MIASQLILFSSQQEVVNYRKLLAEGSCTAQMGVQVVTPYALIAELWSIWGSEEPIVTRHQREMIINVLLQDQQDWVASVGTVDLLARFIEDNVAFLDEEFLARNADAFNETDFKIVAFMQTYVNTLRMGGLIEPAEVCALLSEELELGPITCATQVPLPGYQLKFFETVSTQFGITDPSELFQQAASSGAEPNEDASHAATHREELLLKPAGETAEPYMVFQQVLNVPDASKVLITAPDPVALFETLGPAFAQEGYDVAVEAMIAFPKTVFGRTYCACAPLLDPSVVLTMGELILSAQTYLSSPYAQVSSEKCEMIMQSLISDRTIDPDQVRAVLTANSKSFEFFEELFYESDADLLLAYFEELVPKLGFDATRLRAEKDTIALLKSVYAQARSLAFDPSRFLPFVELLTVPYKKALAGTGQGSVVITDLGRAATYEPESFDMLIATGLDSERYSGASHNSTLTEFARRYHLPLRQDELHTQEQRFRSALKTAPSVVFEYAAQSLDGQEHYPAFFLEEHLNTRAMEGASVPVESLGEEHFDETARMGEIDAAAVRQAQRVVRASIAAGSQNPALRYAQNLKGEEVPVVSPSSIERYLNCPYRWFVERTLHLDDIGEEFGPREIGTFVHSVYQTLFDRLAKQEIYRVSAETMRDVLLEYDQVFDELLEEQLKKEPGDRLVAVNQLEKEQIAQLKNQVRASLQFQEEMFKGYRIKEHECALVPEDKIPYAGALIQGRIDRIDTNDANDFIIVDYKGSLAGHAAGYSEKNEEFELPEKVQTLIYTQALRRKFPDMKPRGSVYLSYRAKTPKDLLRGSLSEVLDENLPLTTGSCLVEGSFEAYLNRIEAELEAVVERMKAGDIAPCPRTKHSCRNCPVLYCEKRADGS